MNCNIKLIDDILQIVWDVFLTVGAGGVIGLVVAQFFQDSQKVKMAFLFVIVASLLVGGLYILAKDEIVPKLCNVSKVESNPTPGPYASATQGQASAQEPTEAPSMMPETAETSTIDPTVSPTVEPTVLPTETIISQVVVCMKDSDPPDFKLGYPIWTFSADSNKWQYFDLIFFDSCFKVDGWVKAPDSLYTNIKATSQEKYFYRINTDEVKIHYADPANPSAPCAHDESEEASFCVSRHGAFLNYDWWVRGDYLANQEDLLLQLPEVTPNGYPLIP